MALTYNKLQWSKRKQIMNSHTTYAKRYNYTKKVHNIYKNMKNRRTVNNK